MWIILGPGKTFSTVASDIVNCLIYLVYTTRLGSWFYHQIYREIVNRSLLQVRFWRLSHGGIIIPSVVGECYYRNSDFINI
jgi:hypothetical protein